MVDVSSLLEKNSSSNTLIVGSIIQGRYQVLSKIKGGALSRTYLVQDLSQSSEPKCVLKHYPYNKEIPRLYKTNMRLFLKEAKHLQILSVHPQIPRLIDYFGITDQGWFLVQELVEGKLLNNTLPMSEYSENCWTVCEVARFIHDACETLQFVHSQKIIHCDLKPNNLIRRSSDGRLTIIDFGSAQYIPGFQMGGEDSSATSFRSKITVSPSGYLAPEQLNSQPQVCSDFYALGVMAIQAWTGLDPARMKKDSHTGEFVWDQYVKIDQPEACRRLVAIIAKMVQPDIGDRYHSAKGLLEELDTFLNTFDDSEPLAIDYENISFEDASLFKKPDDIDVLEQERDKAKDKTKTKEIAPVAIEDISVPQLLSPEEVILPPALSKETYIQKETEEERFYQQTFIQGNDDLLDFEAPSLAEFQDEDATAIQGPETSELSTEDLPSRLKRQKPAGKKLPMLALISISVVVINGLLVAFGLQHLIKNMAPSEAVDPDLQRAQDAYAQGNLPEAIAIAQAIPQQSAVYQQAQANLTLWQGELSGISQGQPTPAIIPTDDLTETPETNTSDGLALSEAESSATELNEPEPNDLAATPTTPTPDELQLAQDAYDQGNLEEAIAMAQTIPADHPNFAQAQTSLKTWEEELTVQTQTQNQAQIDQVTAIEAAFTVGDWQTVVAKGKDLQDPVVQAQMAKQIETAQFQIDVAAYQWVQKAFDLATEHKFDEALLMISEAPPNSKFANVITDKGTEYQQKKAIRNQYYLQQAVNRAEAREFKEAVVFLEQISSDSKHAALADVKIVEYTEKQEVKEAYERWAAAQDKQPNQDNTNTSAMRFGKETSMVTRQLQPAQLLGHLNPGMALRHIA